MLFLFLWFPFSFKAFSELKAFTEQPNEKLRASRVKTLLVFNCRSNGAGKSVFAVAFLFGFSNGCWTGRNICSPRICDPCGKPQGAQELFLCCSSRSKGKRWCRRWTTSEASRDKYLQHHPSQLVTFLWVKIHPALDNALSIIAYSRGVLS